MTSKTCCRAAVLLSAAILAAACEEDAARPDDDGQTGVRFDSDAGGAYVAEGAPSADDVLSQEFAVARADSVGGFAVIGWDPTGDASGNLFVLQAPRETQTFECTLHATPCHGRLIVGVTDLNTAAAGRYFHVMDGSLTVTQIGPQRMRASFTRLTLRALDDKPDDTIVLENGTIDVPYVSDEVTDGSLQCLLFLVGIGDGPCANSGG